MRQAHAHNRASFVCFSFSRSLGLGLSIVDLLVHEPLNAAGDALLEGPEGPVAEDTLGLGDVVVTGHAGEDDALAGKGGILADDVEEDLAAEAKSDAEVAGHSPPGAGTALVAGGTPDSAGKVPKVDGGVVGDEEGLAVDALVIQRHGGRGGGDEEGLSSQEVRVGDVAHVGEVEQVGVVAHLNVGLAAMINGDETRERLHVALAKDACGADGGGEEFWGGFLAVGFEDEVFCGSL